LSLFSVLLTISAFTIPAFGEDLLKKAGDEYLGWKISGSQFKTCDGSMIDIGDGRIEKTSRRCTSPPPPSARWEGTVLRINNDASYMDVRNSAGLVKRVHWDSSTTWTKLNKPIDDHRGFKAEERVTCLGVYEENGTFHATRIDLRPPK
jgi:hypothetical protein